MTTTIDPRLQEQIRGTRPTADGIRTTARLLEAYHQANPESDSALRTWFVAELARLHEGLRAAEAQMEAIRQLHEKLTAPPWHLATFLARLPDTDQAWVCGPGGRRLVQLADELAQESLAVGEELLLSHDLNFAARRATGLGPSVGETARFRRLTEDGRLVVESHQEQFVVQPADWLCLEDLREDDAIRWDRQAGIALEKVAQPPSQRYFVTEVPDVRPEQVGGQKSALQKLLNALTTILIEPDKARSYGLHSRQTVLLEGPAGCGKTLMSRVVAATITRMSGVKCHFAVVKPAEWENPFVGATQQNIRDCFAAVRQAAGEHDFAVLFLDEVESVARIRGDMLGQHNDKFVAALLAELDGFTSRGRVAIIAATNRKDMLDPAIAERLSDLQIRIPRPDLRGTREIFQIHLGESLPYNPNGQASRHTRAQLIERAVSRLFDPNGATTLSQIRFRDGKTRPVAARELISGRLIEQICRAAKQAAFLRDVQLGEAGLRIEDIDEAVSQAIANLATTLTPRNIRSYLDDLPQDSDVVAVEPVQRRSGPRWKYTNHATV